MKLEKNKIKYQLKIHQTLCSCSTYLIFSNMNFRYRKKFHKQSPNLANKYLLKVFEKILNLRKFFFILQTLFFFIIGENN